MKCNNCGTEFNEGMFCPECGTKYVVSAAEHQKAQSILDELDAVEKEKEMITRWGWSDDKEVNIRILARLDVYSKVKGLNVKTTEAKKMIERMRIDLIDDYRKLEKEGDGVGSQKIVAIVCTILSILFAPGFGIIGIVIGVILCAAYWSAVKNLKKSKQLAIELKSRIDNL